MKKAIAMIQKRTGRRCYGWRSCTQSTNTIELLIDNGFVFNTNCFHEELPFLYEKDGKVMWVLEKCSFFSCCFCYHFVFPPYIFLVPFQPRSLVKVSGLRRCKEILALLYPLQMLLVFLATYLMVLLTLLAVDLGDFQTALS